MTETNLVNDIMAALQRTSPSLSPQSGSSNGGRKLPTPRGSRLSVRDNRKEAIAASLTLDFVSLSACDREMVQECEDCHAQTEARKRSFCTAKEPSGSAASTKPKRHRRSLVLAPPKSPALSSEGGPSSELGDFDLRLNMTKPPKQREPIRPQSSRGGDSRCGDSMFDDTSLQPTGIQSTTPGGVPPLLRSLRMFADVHLRPPSSLLGYCPASRAGFSSTHNSVPTSSPRDLTNFSPRPPYTGGEETPPGVSNAFEAHAKLVRCPAPRRPATFRRPVQNQRRPRSALLLVEQRAATRGTPSSGAPLQEREAPTQSPWPWES